MRQGAQGWCTGMNLRDGMRKEVGGRVRIWRFLKKLKIELSYDSAIPLLGTYLERIIIQKDTFILMFTAALFTTARTQKQPKCPSQEEWIEKMLYIYKMEYYSSIKE